MTQENTTFGFGTEVSSVKDIKNFMNKISKKFNIKKEPGIVKMICDVYLSDPVGKDHLVFNSNAQGEWFCQFLSDADVVARKEVPNF